MGQIRGLVIFESSPLAFRSHGASSRTCPSWLSVHPFRSAVVPLQYIVLYLINSTFLTLPFRAEWASYHRAKRMIPTSVASSVLGVVWYV
ncbi:hypothetical protein BDW74DRAFT_150190 [Aspergillus multicolor]|uniref:uncharacterized protein n=1 Tax=Aspergillus multicolor TaxID=41759 RepID=UPI003CCE4A36